MIDPAVLDGQKIKYHTEVLERWLVGREVWPVYVEVGLTGACNNRCVFCAYDYLPAASSRLSGQVLKPALKTLAANGTKACMFAGEGEPSLHPELVELVGFARSHGIDLSITSNFLAMSPSMLREILPGLSWIRCSLNATDATEYRAIHQGPSDGFERVLDNLSDAVEIKRRNKLDTTIGVQFILLPDNVDRLPEFARRLRGVGVDYLSIKPCIQHPKMTYKAADIDKNRLEAVLREVESIRNERFSVIIRRASIESFRREERGYVHCHALSFFVEIISDGRVFSCGPHLGDERFCYGNLNEKTIEDIWLGERRRKIRRWVEESLELDQCMRSCRLDQVNKFLWSLKHPPAHVNFI